ncbi:MAG: ATP-binding protein [Solirubrobacteraceae bacterium]
MRFVGKKSNVLLIRPPGVGKTLLATAPGPESRTRRPPRHYTAAGLVARTTCAAIEDRWQTTIAVLGGPSRPCV